MKKSDLKINESKIRSFLNQLTDAETIYITHVVELASGMREVVRRYKLTKERFCEEMAINKSQYTKYMKGTSYSLKDVAKLNALTCRLICENAEKQVPVKIVQEKK